MFADRNSPMVMAAAKARAPHGWLNDYATGERVRPATETEARASKEAAEVDGGAGVITQGQFRYYVTAY